MRILGIETSCDETAAAVIEGLGTRGQGLELSVLSSVVASQMKIHAKTGGVVPEVAARAHVEKIIPVVQKALRDAGVRYQGSGVSIGRSNLKPKTWNLKPAIDAIAVTAGPGLMTSLLVGVEVARTLSWLWKKPVVAVNHLAGHVYANWLPAEVSGVRNQVLVSKLKPKTWNLKPFPLLCLIVSGGHTELVLMRRHLDFKVIGATRDDAAGEAFDKVAKMLKLRYPGGPAIAAEAAKVSGVRDQVSGIRSELKPKTYNLKPVFPRPMIDSPNFDFSFSGLKTAVLYYLKGVRDQVSGVSKSTKSNTYNLTPKTLTQVCYEFQEAVTDVLVSKTVRAAKQYKVKTVLLGGGVAANQRLRKRLQQAIATLTPVTCHLTPIQYTTDNAAMIAAAGYFMARAKQFTPWDNLDVDPHWQLGSKFHPIPRG